MKSIWRWSAALVIVAATVVLVLVVARSHGRAGGQPESTTTTEPAKDEHTGVPGHVTLKPEQVEHAGLKTQPVRTATLAPEKRLFGVIQEDPGASFVVRAPAAGTIEAARGKEWPVIGESIADGSILGSLRPRPMPSDQITLASQRVTLETQISAARAELRSATASLEAAKKAYERQKALNAFDKGVPDRVVEEALVKVKTEEARAEGAKQTLELATAALPAQAQLTPMPLSVNHGGQVVEVSARPGESVESGQAVVRVVRLTRVLAALDVPPGEKVNAGAKEARIVPIGSDAKPVTGTRLGTTGASDPRTKGLVLLYRIALSASAAPVPPGTPVTAYVPEEGEPLQGVTVPRNAVVRYLGKAWVYVAVDANEFERREVSLDHPAPSGDGWFVVDVLKGDELVVTVGAQILMSYEINAAFGGCE